MASNSTLKILIVEDDLLLARELQEQLLGFGYTVADCVANSTDALLAFRRRLPGLVLCDIQLEGSEMDGIQLAEAFNEIAELPLIFLTAFGDEATVERARAVKPAYYLVKPCNEVQLKVAIDMALANFSRQAEADPRHSLQYQSAPPCALYSARDFFFVKSGYRYDKVEVAQVAFVEALGANVKILTDEQAYVLTANLSSFLEQAAHPSLMRVHRSYVLNIFKVRSFDAGRAFVEYQGGLKQIPVSKKYRDDFLDRLPRLRSD